MYAIIIVESFQNWQKRAPTSSINPEIFLKSYYMFYPKNPIINIILLILSNLLNSKYLYYAYNPYNSCCYLGLFPLQNREDDI